MGLVKEKNNKALPADSHGAEHPLWPRLRLRVSVLIRRSRGWPWWRRDALLSPSFQSAIATLYEFQEREEQSRVFQKHAGQKTIFYREGFTGGKTGEAKAGNAYKGPADRDNGMGEDGIGEAGVGRAE